jgi:hypothetical protein
MRRVTDENDHCVIEATPQTFERSGASLNIGPAQATDDSWYCHLT